MQIEGHENQEIDDLASQLPQDRHINEQESYGLWRHLRLSLATSSLPTPNGSSPKHRYRDGVVKNIVTSFARQVRRTMCE